MATASASPVTAPAEVGTRSGYHGLPVLKPPVWTWEVPAYFFVGGTAGMLAVLGAVTLWTYPPTLPVGAVRGWPDAAAFGTILWCFRLAVAGAVVSPLLLVRDLGRRRRFANMLRVFKPRSPMSVGVWTLVAFGGTVAPAWLILERAGEPAGPPGWILRGLTLAAAGLGLVLATYTGVLLAVTAIPIWSRHRRLLPLHFGVASLGSAAALLILVDAVAWRPGAGWPMLPWLVLGASVVETALLGRRYLGRDDPGNRSVHVGFPGGLLRLAGWLTGPVTLGLIVVAEGLTVTYVGTLGIPPSLQPPTPYHYAGYDVFPATTFLVGALLSRYGWVAAGRTSALDPAEVLEARAPETPS